MPEPTITGTPQGTAFTASGTVITYSGGGDTGSGVFDVLCVNSDNIVTTPSGWSVTASRIVNQGSYIFTRAGGTTTATIDLGGGVSTNTSALWLRVKNVDSIDTGATATAGADGSPLSNTPAVTSGALASASSMVVAFAALHALGGGTPTSPVWSAGYTQQATATIGGATTGVYGNVAVKTPAGTAAESPSLSWTNTANNRYILVIAFTGTAAATPVAPDSLSVTVALGDPTIGYGLAPAPDSLEIPLYLGEPTSENGEEEAPTPGAGGGSGGWWSLVSIMEEAGENLREDRAQAPSACPNDGEPLLAGPRGELYCPFDGWRPR